MPPRKASAKLPNAKKNSKSGTGKYSDEHPELQTNYWEFQEMTYDSAVARSKVYNLILLMVNILGCLSLSNCQMFLLSWHLIS